MAALQLQQLQIGALKPIDLTIKAGECVCLSGASGAGKTRLLRAMADLDSHDGELRVGAERCDQMRAHRWRQRVAFLPAESQWWAETVGEHFTIGARVPLARLSLPSNCMSRKVAELSTGERQRLALLRLLAGKPQVLLLDEPTASLDTDSRRQAERLIDQYRRRHKAAVLWVSHDRAQISRVADRHLTLRAGRLREQRR